MGLVDRVTARARAPRHAERADPVSMEEFGYLLANGRNGTSRSKSGVLVGERRAQGISSWWRGVRYLSETMASLPIHTYRDRLVERVKVRSMRADPPWMRKPDVELPWFALVECWMMSELHRGNAYAFKIRNQASQVIGLRPLHPDRVRVGQASDGTKVFQIDGNTDRGWTTREILHVPGLSSDGIVGIDPIRAHAETLGIVAAGDEYAARFYGDGDHTRAYLSVPQHLSQLQADDLKQRWEEFHKGMQHAHGFGVLGNGAEYKVVGLDAEQAQLLEARRYGVTEVARILGVVPHKLYDLERATFSNIEHQAIESVMDGIRPWCVRFEAFINSDPDLLPPGNFVEFQLEGLLRGDTKSRYDSYRTAIDSGWMMPATAAQLENVDAPEELQYYRFPLNTAALRPGQGIEIPAHPTAGDAPKEEAA